MITTVQFRTLDELYSYYNKALFGGALADCIVNMSRHSGTFGFFSAKRWKTEENGEKRLVHEISLNPDHLDRPFVEWHSTLVHEMVHLWQEDMGHPSRAAYHNKEWAYKMEAVGLVPTDTGAPGGKKTGQHMTHYANPEGEFLKAFNGLTAETLEALRLKYLPAYSLPEPAKRKRRGGDDEGGSDEEGAEGGADEPGAYNSKKKYSCPCGVNVWGRPGLRLVCGECGAAFQEA